MKGIDFKHAHTVDDTQHIFFGNKEAGCIQHQCPIAEARFILNGYCGNTPLDILNLTIAFDSRRQQQTDGLQCIEKAFYIGCLYLNLLRSNRQLIGFESEFDKGSLFWAVLPCQFDSVDSEPTSSRRNNEKDADNESILDSEETKKVPKRVLVVEDIQSNFFLVSSILKNKCQLLHAPNGLEAVEIVRTQPVDLVLMDMKMPVMDGRTATSEIRKFNAEIPIIALTANAIDADRVAAWKAGCDDYLVKPINGAKLMQTLKEYGC